jgi:hypothetical protein
MTATDTDPVLIQTALWNFIDTAGVSANIFVSNRPNASRHDDFVVVDINGVVTDKAGHARCVCLVQLFAKDIDQKGTENMAKLSEMYETLIDALPYNTAPYTFRKKNQVGRRDSLGYHATLVNLDCLIY